MRTVTVICRLTSRNGLDRYRRLAEELPKRGVRIAEAHLISRRRDLRDRIRQAAASQAEYIAVIGGDGTQSAAVGELVHSRSVMAVVPGGTGNSFALGLGIQDDVDAVADMIANGKETRIDVGVVNGTCFANFATIGIPAEAAKRASTGLKKIAGPVAYGVAAIGALFAAKPFEMRIRWKRNRMRVVTHQAIVAGGRYYGWQPLTPDASPRSGKLTFFCAAGANVGDVLATNAALLRGDQTQLDRAHYFSARKIVVKTKPRQALNVDGHALGKTPARFTILPKALRVLVPAGYTDPA